LFLNQLRASLIIGGRSQPTQSWIRVSGSSAATHRKAGLLKDDGYFDSVPLPPVPPVNFAILQQSMKLNGDRIIEAYSGGKKMEFNFSVSALSKKNSSPPGM